MRTHDEPPIRRLFERAREEDAAAVPPFARVLERPLKRPPLVWSARGRWLPLAAGLAALAAWPWLVTVSERPHGRPATTEDAAFVYWQSPTAALLTAPGDLEGLRRLAPPSRTPEEGSDPR